MNDLNFYKNLAKDLADPTKLVENIDKLNKSLEADFSELDTMKTNYETQLNALRDTNAKLALRVTGDYTTPDDDNKFYTDIESQMKGVK